MVDETRGKTTITGGRWRRIGRIAHVAEAVIIAGAVVVVLGCAAVLWVLLADPERGEEWTSGLRPVQFYGEFEVDLLENYEDIFVVAHNSGDDVGATLDAITAGADVIEVDVVMLNGRLYAAHGSPPLWFGESLFRAPRLERVWLATAGADAIKLDLKDASPAFLEAVFSFLESRRGQRLVVVVSSNPDVLHAFATREPDIIRFLSIGTADQFDALRGDAYLTEAIDGVSIRHPLMDDERAAWFEDQGLLTLAWTVNDLSRVNDLVELGADAITTDNLAIMTLLGGEQQGERQLQRIREAHGPLEEPL